jgi:hypothetical protein
VGVRLDKGELQQVEELDFFIRSALPLASSKNYDIKYRMGDELSD